MKKKLVFGALSLGILGLTLLLSYYISSHNEKPQVIPEAEVLPVEQHLEYGINCDSLRVERGFVRQDRKSVV